MFIRFLLINLISSVLFIGCANSEDTQNKDISSIDILNSDQKELFKQCNQKILFLPQAHNTKYALIKSLDDTNEIASSQLQIARFLQDYNDPNIFTEQLTTFDVRKSDFTSEELKELKNMMSNVFPEGLPESVDLLTSIQKEKLINNGGEFINFFLENTTQLRRVVKDKKSFHMLFDPINEWYNSSPQKTYPKYLAKIIYDEREKHALNLIANFFNENKEEELAILIFGANHNFSRFPNIFPTQCIFVPKQFQERWSGKDKK